MCVTSVDWGCNRFLFGDNEVFCKRMLFLSGIVPICLNTLLVFGKARAFVSIEAVLLILW